MENVNLSFGAKISRRTLLRAGGVTMALPVLDAMTPAFAENAATASEQVPEGPLFSDFDEIRTEATGFISLKEIDGNWWFIDPNGYAFFPIGVTHSMPFPGIVKQFSSRVEYYATAFDWLRKLGFNSLSVLGGPVQGIARKKRVAYIQPINLGIPHGTV